ncbi:N-acetylmuramoyl-L-alanine amidase, partial [Candidatus Sumerlaeota bacterium]|nr:N-acetylmuramoyl-L-alanine amidase [Candidatus Sumerlaeota bacterium]
MKKTHYLILLSVLFTMIVPAIFAAGVAPQPSICNRACWSARAPQGTIYYMSALNRAVIHHTAGASDYNTTSLETTKSKVRATQNYHMDSLGWSDIGYNFLIDKLGYILEGRHNSMGSYTKGAHDAINNCSFGFSNLGYFHTPYNHAATTAMRNACYDVIAWRIPNPFTGYGGGYYGGQSNRGYVCGHRDVGQTACPGDIWYGYIGTNLSGGEARNSINARIVGNPVINPPYWFDSTVQGWTAGNGMTSPIWTGGGWPGIMYSDQVGSDGFLYSPPTDFAGKGGETVQVRLYVQDEDSPNHDMKIYWLHSGDQTWNESKSSPLVGYSALNSWYEVFLDVDNSLWNGKTITDLRLDFDANNQWCRFIVDYVTFSRKLPFTFEYDCDLWYLGNGLVAPWWTNCCGWPGIMVLDQTGNDALVFSPGFHYVGQSGDYIRVRVFPQLNAGNHDMQVFWVYNQDRGWSEARSTGKHYFSGCDQYVN